MKYRYFANVMSHAEFEIEAGDQEQADQLATRRLLELERDELEVCGSELGRFTGDGGSWETVQRSGDFS